MWTAFIARYIQHGLDDGALKSRVSFISILMACSSIASLKLEEVIHMEVTRKGLLGDMVLGTVLVVDM